jgi:hypothetical protein
MTKDKKVEKASIIPFLSFTVSILALLLSGFSARTSYVNAFAPADLRVACSDPTWYIQQLSLRPIGQLHSSSTGRLVAKLSCSFTNTGSASGVVQHLAYRLEATDGTKWLFAPYLLVDDAKWQVDGRNSFSWSKGSFSPVTVPGKQTVSNTYIF